MHAGVECSVTQTEQAMKSSSPRVKLTAMEHCNEDELGDRSPGSIDSHGGSGLSKLRVFSPAASPSAGILRKRQLSKESDAGSDTSPSLSSSKVRHLPVLTGVCM